MRVIGAIIGRPQPVVLYRNDPVHEPTGFPYTTEAVTPDVPVEQAPNPYPAATLFSGYGRDSKHAPTPLRTWTGGLAMPEILSVMGWPFAFGRPLTPLRTSFPVGVQNPVQGRVIIQAPRATSLGAMTALAASARPSADLAKLTF